MPLPLTEAKEWRSLFIFCSSVLQLPHAKHVCPLLVQEYTRCRLPLTQLLLGRRFKGRDSGKQGTQPGAKHRFR